MGTVVTVSDQTRALTPTAYVPELRASLTRSTPLRSEVNRLPCSLFDRVNANDGPASGTEQ